MKANIYSPRYAGVLQAANWLRRCKTMRDRYLELYRVTYGDNYSVLSGGACVHWPNDCKATIRKANDLVDTAWDAVLDARPKGIPRNRVIRMVHEFLDIC